MMKGKVYYDSVFCGILEETDTGYRFTYLDDWFNAPDAPAISLTMPKDRQIYESPVFFPFFDGLIPEGYLLKQVTDRWGLPYNDRFRILLKSGRDTIGVVSIEELEA